jgi:hypothetical protein
MDVMRRLVAALGIWCFSLGMASASTALDSLDALYARYIVAGEDGINRVAYNAWKQAPADRAALDAAIAALTRERPSQMPSAAQFAYWANLYNALTLQEVLRHYPVASIRDIKSRGVLDFGALIGPWKTHLATVEGRRLSLDDIEHGIMRPTFRDPRVHYALNCASIGCPNLQHRVFRAETLEAQLDAAARIFINHRRGVRLEGGQLRLNSIYDWFRIDFGDVSRLRAHLVHYAEPDVRRAILASTRIAGYDYDWRLNDVGTPR